MPASPRTRIPPRIRHDERPLSQRGVRQPTLISAEDKATVAFNEYIHAHAEIFAAFRDVALQLYNAGRRHSSAKAIVEKLRYETAVRAQGEAFKIDNSMTSRMARQLAGQDARFAQFFAFRVLKEPKGRRV